MESVGVRRNSLEFGDRVFCASCHCLALVTSECRTGFSFQLLVDQSFGYCPQYIQKRQSSTSVATGTDKLTSKLCINSAACSIHSQWMMSRHLPIAVDPVRRPWSLSRLLRPRTELVQRREGWRHDHTNAHLTSVVTRQQHGYVRSNTADPDPKG